MMKAAASKAACRCADAVATSTISSPGTSSAEAVNNARAEERPARASFGLDALNLGHRHRRIVVERHRNDAIIGVPCPAEAGEGHDGPDIRAAGRKASSLRADIERLALQTNGHVSHQ